MLKHYPVRLQLVKKEVVVVGGGDIAERKLAKLVGTGAFITVISPDVTRTIQGYVDEGEVIWKQKLFNAEDVATAFLIVAATNCSEVNRLVFEASHSNQLLNIIDDPKRSNFIVPATLSRGKLDISVSTGGASPGLAKQIVAQLASQFDQSYEDYLEFLGDCRSVVLERIAEPKARQHIFKKLLEPIFLELTKAKKLQEREEYFQRLLRLNGERDEG